jgi:hypothetical protein
MLDLMDAISKTVACQLHNEFAEKGSEVYAKLWHNDPLDHRAKFIFFVTGSLTSMLPVR